MKKIPCVFVREFPSPREVIITREVTPGCEWVIAGEGVASRKWDGTAVLIRDGKAFARYDAKRGKTPPPNFEPCCDHDPVTGHWPGWVPADGPESKWIREAYANFKATFYGVVPPDGTYEACGPKINGNNEGLDGHALLRHGNIGADTFGRDFDSIRESLVGAAIEGIVFHHPDGRMAKIRRVDFGLPWPVRGES